MIISWIGTITTSGLKCGKKKMGTKNDELKDNIRKLYEIVSKRSSCLKEKKDGCIKRPVILGELE
ncbi:hypothetical protein FRX31_035355, partial [Thalictrum thalictroides]